MFATAGSSIKLWDDKNYKQYQEIKSVSGHVTDISWSQNGQCIAFLGESAPDISLYAVNSKSAAHIGVVRGLDSPSCIQFPCRSSHYLGVGYRDGSVALWNLKSISRKKVFTASDTSISNIAFNHNDSHIAAAAKGHLHLLSLMNNSVGGPYKIFDNQNITEVVYSRVKKSLLGCCSDGGSLSLFDANACKTLHTFRNAHAAPVSTVAFSPINEILMISAGYDKKLGCYNIQTKKQVLHHKCSEPLCSAAFLPGGQHIALGAMTGEVFIHDLRNLRSPLATLAAHDKSVTKILLQPSTKHTAESMSSDVKALSSKTKNIEATSVPSSKAPLETPAKSDILESIPNSTSLSSYPPEVGSFPVELLRIFSPVRSTEEVQKDENELGEQKNKNQFILENVLSPVRHDDLENKEDFASFSTKKPIADMYDDIFSPVRDSTQNAGVHDVNCQDGSYTDQRKDSDPLKDPISITATSELLTSFKDIFPPEVVDQKENVDPNPSLNKKDNKNKSELSDSEKLGSKYALSPVRPAEISRQTLHPPVSSIKRAVVEVPEFYISISSQKDSESTGDEMKEVLSLKTHKDISTSPVVLDYTSKIPEDHTLRPACGETTVKDASQLQIELIKSCIADVLEEFQDDVNKRMMHLQYIVTKQYLQLKETVENLQKQQALDEELLLELQHLRKENARLRANF